MTVGHDGPRIAAGAGADVLGTGAAKGPLRTVIDSREAGPGDLFVGLPGERYDGGQFASRAISQGAWGVLVGTQWARELSHTGAAAGGAWLLGAADPLAALQSLGRWWRNELGCKVIGVTGSVGKTSVKDVCATILPLRTHASPENFNTEIGLPLAILSADAGTELLVLEMGMRGTGQIAELCEIAEPDVGVITNVGPVHVELLGSVAAVAAAKAEIITGLRLGGTAVVPAPGDAAGELEDHLKAVIAAGSPALIRFGAGGDVNAKDTHLEDGRTVAQVMSPGAEHRFEFPFTEAHNLNNALAAIGAGLALGLDLAEMAARAPRIVFSRLRGELVPLPGGATLINDCYNANPVSMRAALDHLGSLEPAGRRIAVLGEMRELGADAEAFHREIGRHARDRNVELVVGVGELAAAYEPDIQTADAGSAARALEAELGPGDAVLVKGSRAVRLEQVAELLGHPGVPAGEKS